MKKVFIIVITSICLFTYACSQTEEKSAYEQYADKNVNTYTMLLNQIYNEVKDNFNVVGSQNEEATKKVIWNNFVINFDSLLDLDDPLEYYITEEPWLVAEKFELVIEYYNDFHHILLPNVQGVTCTLNTLN